MATLTRPTKKSIQAVDVPRAGAFTTNRVSCCASHVGGQSEPPSRSSTKKQSYRVGRQTPNHGPLERRTENCSHARHHERHMSTEGHCALCIMHYGRWGSQEAAIVRNASGDRPGLLTSASVLGVRWAKLGANCKCSLRAVHCSWPHTGLYRVRKEFWNARHA